MNNKSFIVKYSLLFALSAALVYLLYILTGRTFVSDYDGLCQHYNSLLFYGEHLKTVIKTIVIDHRLNVPSFSFSIGEGGDILTMMQFYVVGAPLYALSVFFNSDNMYILYTGIEIVRLYLSGLAFFYLCKTTGIKSESGILIGAISYAFCFYGFWHSTGQAFFLIPLICLPMVIAGTEKIIAGQKPNVFILWVFISSISNFYFFYMIAILTVFYVAIRLICLYGKEFKKYIKPLLSLLVNSLIGTISSGIVIIPFIYALASDARFADSNRIRLFYPLDYYLKLPGILIAPRYIYYLCICILPATLLAIVFMFTRKGSSKTLRALSIFTLIMIIFPFFGQFLNCMSYMSNRWCFAIPLLCSYILSHEYDNLCDDRRFFRIPAFIALGGITLLCVLTGNITDTAVIRVLVILALLITVSAFLPGKYSTSRIRGSILLIFTVLSLFANTSLGSILDNDYQVTLSRRPEEIRDYMTDEGITAGQLLNEQPEFHRYLGQDFHYNSALNSGFSSPSYYWTFSNPGVIEFNDDLGLMYYTVHKYMNFDDRTIMTNLSSVLYYITPEDSAPIPYGYENTGSGIYEGHDIYINSNPLGLTFSTDNTITESSWLELSFAEREESLMYAAVIPDDISQTQTSSRLPLQSINIPYESSLPDSLHIEVSDAPEYYYLYCNAHAGSESRLNLEGVHYTGNDVTTFAIGASDGVIKTMEFYEDGYMFYSGRRNFTVNLGYSDEPVEWIVLAFTEPGVYDFDNISIECIPMDGLPAAIDALNEDVLENVEFGTDMITGDIDLSEDKILVFTIPYSEGWTATVDGEEYPLIRTDIKYMGLDLTAGHHDIVLKYKTPYFGSGVICSITGLGACIVLYIIARKKEAHNVK